MNKRIKTALITGVKGQDGAFLSQLLLKKGYKVIGTDINRSKKSAWKLEELNIYDSINFKYLDVRNAKSIYELLKTIRPDEIYNLGAQTFVKESFDSPILTAEVNAMGCLKILETIRILKLKTKFYQASSSEMFGRKKLEKKN